MILFILFLALVGIGFVIAFFVGLNRTSTPAFVAVDKAISALNQTSVIMSNVTYQEGLSAFVSSFYAVRDIVNGSIPVGQSYLDNAATDNNDRLHLEDLIYVQLDGAMKNLYDNSSKIYETIQKYNDVTKTSNIDVFSLDSVFNYNAIMTNGLVKNMLASHGFLVNALENTQYLVNSLNFTNRIFMGDTDDMWIRMWSGVFVPLSVNAPTTPEQLSQFENLLQKISSPTEEAKFDDILTKFEISYISVFVGLFVIVSIIALMGGIGLTKKSSALLSITCCCSCTVIFWFFLFTAVNISMLMLVGPLCVNGDSLFNPDNLGTKNSPVKMGYYLLSEVPLSTTDFPRVESDLFTQNFSFAVNVTRFFLHCGGPNFDQKPDAKENILDVVQLAQEGWYATTEDYEHFFNLFISGMESLNFTEQANQIAQSGQNLFANMMTIKGGSLPNVGAQLQGYEAALTSFKSRVNNNTLYENYEANKAEITNFQNEMNPILDALIEEAKNTYQVQFTNALNYFNDVSFGEFLNGYNIGSTFMIGYMEQLQKTAPSLVTAAQTVGDLLNDLKERTTCSFMEDAYQQVTTDVCGIMGISSFGVGGTQYIIALLLFALLPVGIVLRGRLNSTN